MTALAPGSIRTTRRRAPAARRDGAATRELHDAVDANAPWLHPERRTIQRDLGDSRNVVAWQEAKARFIVARRRRVVGAAAPLRALRHAGHDAS